MTSITAVDATNISPGTGGSIASGKEINVASRSVTGGTLYITTLRGAANSDPVGVATAFVPNSGAAGVRRLALVEAKTVAGVPLTVAAQANIFGITCTPGTAEYLISEVANNNTKTDVCFFEKLMSDTFLAAANFNVVVNAHFVIGGGTLSVKTVAVAAYLLNDDDTESTTLETTAAQTITGSAADYTFAVTGATVSPGSRVGITVTMVLTETASSNVTGRVNSVRLTGA